MSGMYLIMDQIPLKNTRLGFRKITGERAEKLKRELHRAGLEYTYIVTTLKNVMDIADDKSRSRRVTGELVSVKNNPAFDGDSVCHVFMFD